MTRHDNGDLGLWFPWLREQLSSRLSSRLSSTDQFTHPWTEDLASRQAHLTKGQTNGFGCGATSSNNTRHQWLPLPDHRPQGPTRTNRKSWADQQLTHTHSLADQDQTTATTQSGLIIDGGE